MLSPVLVGMAPMAVAVLDIMPVMDMPEWSIDSIAIANF